ncbi:hypothetical protein CSUI_008186, partial [Cystoisospora suis]
MDPPASSAVVPPQSRRKGRTKAHRKRRGLGQAFTSGKPSNEDFSSPTAPLNSGASDTSSFASPQFRVENDPVLFSPPTGTGERIGTAHMTTGIDNTVHAWTACGGSGAPQGGSIFLSTEPQQPHFPSPSKGSASRLSPDFRSLPSSPSSSSAYSSIDEDPGSPGEEELHHLPPPREDMCPPSFAGIQNPSISHGVFDKGDEPVHKGETEPLVSRSTDTDESSSVQKTASTCSSLNCRGREIGPGLESSKRSPSAGFSGLGTPVLLERPLSAAAAAVAAIRLWKTNKDISTVDEPGKVGQDLSGLDTPANSELLQENDVSSNSEAEGTIGVQNHEIEETSVLNILGESTGLSGERTEDGLVQKPELLTDELQVTKEDCKEPRPQEEEQTEDNALDGAVLEGDPGDAHDHDRGKKAIGSVKNPAVAQLPAGSIRSREAEEVSMLIENQWRMLVGSQGWEDVFSSVQQKATLRYQRLWQVINSLTRWGPSTSQKQRSTGEAGRTTSGAASVRPERQPCVIAYAIPAFRRDGGRNRKWNKCTVHWFSAPPHPACESNSSSCGDDSGDSEKISGSWHKQPMCFVMEDPCNGDVLFLTSLLVDPGERVRCCFFCGKD